MQGTRRTGNFHLLQLSLALLPVRNGLLLHELLYGNGFSITLDFLTYHHKPLAFNLWLDDAAGTLGRRDIVCVDFFFDDEIFGAEFLDDERASLCNIHAGKFSGDRKEFPLFIDDLF